MSQLLATLFPSQFKPQFITLGSFTHKAIPLDALGKRVTKGTPNSKAENIETAAKIIAGGEDTIIGVANEMNVSVSSANEYISALIKQGRVIKERSNRANGVYLRMSD